MARRSVVLRTRQPGDAPRASAFVLELALVAGPVSSAAAAAEEEEEEGFAFVETSAKHQTLVQMRGGQLASDLPPLPSPAGGGRSGAAQVKHNPSSIGL